MCAYVWWGRFQRRGVGWEAWEWEEVSGGELVGWKAMGQWEWSSRSRVEEIMG